MARPDLLFIAKQRLAIVDSAGGVCGAPDLVIEILSPSTASRDQVLKRKLYAKYGVREFWVVDPESHTVEVLTQAPGGLETWRVFPEGSVAVSPLLPGLSLPVVVKVARPLPPRRGGMLGINCWDIDLLVVHVRSFK